MNVDTPKSSIDSLSRLRIQRDVPAQAASTIGRLVRWLILLCLVIGFAVGGVVLSQRQGWLPDSAKLLENMRPRPEVRVAVVSLEKGRSADALVVATGYIESRRQARIGARATGRIEKMNVEEGSKVKTNDVLAVLEHADLDASLAAVRAMAARSKTEILEQNVEIQRAERDFARAEKGFASRAMTPADFDEFRFKRDAALARKASLEAAQQLAEARVREAEQLLENMFVRAPFDGTVISKDAELGESILPGGMGEASGRGSVVTIADLDHLEVDSDVKEDFISRILEGQSVEIAVDAVPDRRYKGNVRKIIPMGDRARATVKVKVEITDANGRLFPEMSCTVYFLSMENEASTKQDQSRVFCLTDAILSADSETFVWVVTSGDRTQKIAVTVGDTNDGRTEITSGLSGGEKVIVKPSLELRNDVLVKTVQ